MTVPEKHKRREECTTKDINVYVADNLKQTCQGEVRGVYLPPTKMVRD